MLLLICRFILKLCMIFNFLFFFHLFTNRFIVCADELLMSGKSMFIIMCVNDTQKHVQISTGACKNRQCSNVFIIVCSKIMVVDRQCWHIMYRNIQYLLYEFFIQFILHRCCLIFFSFFFHFKRNFKWPQNKITRIYFICLHALY